MDSPPAKSWSIHSRPEIIAKYKILERVGSGAYSDVYRAIRLSDNLTVALKAVHDYQSAFREIEALHSCPNVIVLYEYFWRENEDAVLVLEFLTTDLATVIKSAKKREGGIGCGKVKRWMLQILSGVDSCHRNMVVHRDLKPCNLLIGDDGVLKLADFGQPAPAPAPAPDCFTNPRGDVETESRKEKEKREKKKRKKKRKEKKKKRKERKGMMMVPHLHQQRKSRKQRKKIKEGAAAERKRERKRKRKRKE